MDRICEPVLRASGMGTSKGLVHNDKGGLHQHNDLDEVGLGLTRC